MCGEENELWDFVSDVKEKKAKKEEWLHMAVR
jgi:hypothetical protein